MKNKILLLIISLLLIPTFVYAKDTCNDNDIKIKSITLKELNGFSEEIQESSVNNNTINLNLKMYDVGDSSTYDITVENTSNEDYYFTKDSMKMENDYLEYSLKNDSELIPAKEEKAIELKVSYKNKIPNDSYSDTSKLTISLSDKPLENPKTKMTYTFIFIIISLMAITIYTKINNKPFSKKKLFLIGTLLSIIPLTTTALCTVNLNVETKIEIENKEAVFLPGSEVNIKMKELAGDDTSSVTTPYSFSDTNIISIKYSDVEPIADNKEEKNVVSIPNSNYPIYMWYEDNTIYWWSEDSHPSLNEDSRYMFGALKQINDISGLKNIDASATKRINFLFASSSIKNVSDLKKWNTSSLEDISYMFLMTNYLENLEGLENWNTSNVKNMTGFLGDAYSLKKLSGLENWDTSNVTTLAFMLQNDELLENIDAIKNWNVSKVKAMNQLFCACVSLEEIDLSNWDTSSLENMNHMFGMWNKNGSVRKDSKLKRIILSEKFNTSNVTIMSGLLANNTQIEEYSFLRFIDTSNVIQMSQFFQNNYNLSNLQYLKDWDVSKVTGFQWMFQSVSSLEDASAINNWNISPNANYSNMFKNTPTHPEFTKVQGTWSGGTFTPTP